MVGPSHTAFRSGDRFGFALESIVEPVAGDRMVGRSWFERRLSRLAGRLERRCEPIPCGLEIAGRGALERVRESRLRVRIGELVGIPLASRIAAVASRLASGRGRSASSPASASTSVSRVRSAMIERKESVSRLYSAGGMTRGQRV